MLVRWVEKSFTARVKKKKRVFPGTIITMHHSKLSEHFC